MLIRPLPYRPPETLLAALAGEAHPFFLDSGNNPQDAAPTGDRARYAYLGCDPHDVISLSGPPSYGSAPFARLAAAMGPPEPVLDAPVPFCGGAVGLVGYETGGAGERLPAPKAAPFDPVLFFGLYDVIAAFDLHERKAWILSTGRPETDPDAKAARAHARADRLEALLTTPATLPDPQVPDLAWAAELSRADYMGRVARVIDYIHAGDIFQANFTAGVTAPRPADYSPLAHYLALRDANNPPFGAFLDFGRDRALLSVSPERFLKVTAEGGVSSRPIKGTRPRGRTAAEDKRLAADLTSSVKDRAENLMITDLLRNDLSRVCRAGSVRTPVLVELESFARVHHLVSEVTGTLAQGRSATDLLAAAFPGGSITGAPKIRAMEIIHALEAAPRGAYCGSVVWLGIDGAMDSSIVIRSLVADHATLRIQAGGGIVADSDPAAEYAEMRTKIAPLLMGAPVTEPESTSPEDRDPQETPSCLSA